MNPLNEDFLTLYCDPGEDFGWCIGKGLDLLAAGTHKMWDFADFIWDKLENPDPNNPDLLAVDDGLPVDPNPLSSDTHIRPGVDPALMTLPIERFVVEDFRIYPWAAKELAWDPVRTARVIGAITFMGRLKNIPLTFQGADIKEAAKAAGAEELYYRPLHENRHQNDAIQHFTFFTNVELLNLPMLIPESVHREEYK